MEDQPSIPQSDAELALLAQLSALANPHRLRILAILNGGRQYVSELARQVGISRPLLIMHLRKLEEAGLVKGNLELSADGKAVRYFELQPFEVRVTPRTVIDAVAAWTKEDGKTGTNEGDRASQMGAKE